MKNTTKTIRQLQTIATLGIIAAALGGGSPAEATDIVARLSSCTPRVGSVVRGGVPQLLSSDNSRFIMASHRILTSNQVSFEASASIDASLRSRAAGITFAIEGLSVDSSLARVSLYNWDTRLWDMMPPDIRFFPFDVTFLRYTQDVRHYISANGGIRAMCISGSSHAFRLHVDQLKLTVRILS